VTGRSERVGTSRARETKDCDDTSLSVFKISGMGSFPEADTVNGSGRNRALLDGGPFGAVRSVAGRGAHGPTMSIIGRRGAGVHG
jgi:hypothetical protein